MRARLPSIERPNFHFNDKPPQQQHTQPKANSQSPYSQSSYSHRHDHSATQSDSDDNKYNHPAPLRSLLFRHSRSLAAVLCIALLSVSLTISIVLNLKYSGFLEQWGLLNSEHHENDAEAHDDIIIKHHNPHVFNSEGLTSEALLGDSHSSYQQQSQQIQQFLEAAHQTQQNNVENALNNSPAAMNADLPAAQQNERLGAAFVTAFNDPTTVSGVESKNSATVAESNSPPENLMKKTSDKASAVEAAAAVDKSTETDSDKKNPETSATGPNQSADKSVSASKPKGYRGWTPVPRVVHFIFGLKSDASKVFFRFRHYLAIKAAYDILKPDKVILHYSVMPTGSAWKLAEKMVNELSVVDLDKYGTFNEQPVKSFNHRSDLLRLDVLIQHGGIYFDIDVIVLKSLEEYLTLPCTLGELKPDKSLSNSLIIAKPNAKFLRDWLAEYKKDFNDDEVNKHSAFVPMNLAKWRNFEGINIIKQPSFYSATANELYTENSLDLTNVQAVHLHASDTTQQNDKSLQEICQLNNSYGRVLRVALLQADAMVCEEWIEGMTVEKQLKPGVDKKAE